MRFSQLDLLSLRGNLETCYKDSLNPQAYEGRVACHSWKFLVLEDNTGAVKDAVVEGGEGGAEGEAAEVPREVGAVGL